MSKQLIFVIGAPYSGRTTWINKNLYNSVNSVIIDANFYPNLYVRSEKKDTEKLFEDTIDDSKRWCLEQVKEQMEMETPKQKIILSLIACRPDRWIEFIKLAITYEYELLFKFPSNKLLFYTTKHNTSIEQYKFIDSKTIKKYPRDKKEISRINNKGQNETIIIDSHESTLLRYIITECESAYAFYLANRNQFGVNKEELLTKINDHYKLTLANEVKKTEKRAKDAEREAKKIAIQQEKQKIHEEKQKIHEEKQREHEEKQREQEEKQREQEHEHEHEQREYEEKQEKQREQESVPISIIKSEIETGIESEIESGIVSLSPSILTSTLISIQESEPKLKLDYEVELEYELI